ncbi:crooked neck-like protein 1 [Zophobas morio]|uniref:crooked neck-like protein 1 n=1 Tax=Zophobas morio TaxID=2755281 RepID=UPI0030836AA0
MSNSSSNLPRVAKVKNKQPAPQQITAEQILRDAKERIVEEPKRPKQSITDPKELEEYRREKRKGYEDALRRNRTVVGNWLKYARFEESQNQLTRARSVYERAIDANHRNVTIWMKYSEMELRNRNINHARNIFDRCVSIMPRVDQFWYKYAYVEELLGNVGGARQVFERWMEWEPGEQAWLSYIKMELRYRETERARQIYERFIIVHPEVKNWIKYAKFEYRHMLKARNIYERAVDFFGKDFCNEDLFIAFAEFEEKCNEFERARAIYKYALEFLDKLTAPKLFSLYSAFEKKFGDRAGIEDILLSKKRMTYEKEVLENGRNYDAWFDYAKLEESYGDLAKIRTVYERAISNIPPEPEKRYWRRYIYLWIYYAVFEELVAKDIERTRDVYNAALKIVPSKNFTFGKLWLLLAHFEVRQKNIEKARKILGHAIGLCPKDKVFKGYIELESNLRCFDRCRVIYEKYLEFNPANCTTWISFAKMEAELGDYERAKGLYELAINQEVLDMPELLWKAYIDFEYEEENYKETRNLYKKLLKRTQHVKVWISYAKFEASLTDGQAQVRARSVFEQAHQCMKENELKEERLLVLESWLEFEKGTNDLDRIKALQEMMPKKLKKQRLIDPNDPSAGLEEYYDLLFPDAKSKASNFIHMAHLWKQKQLEQTNQLQSQ